MNAVLVIPAAGSGTRLGYDQPKAFVPVAGRTILEHCVRAALQAALDRIVIVVPRDMIAHAQQVVAPLARKATPVVQVIAGGTERFDSVRLALEYLQSARGQTELGLVNAPDYVLVHDAARCLTPLAVFDRVLNALKAGHKNVVPVLPAVDTVRAVSDTATSDEPASSAGTCETLSVPIERTALRRIQTPQGFDCETLIHAHRLQHDAPDPGITDDAGLVEKLGIPAVGVPGDEHAMKITYPFDIKIAELIVQEVCRKKDDDT